MSKRELLKSLPPGSPVPGIVNLIGLWNRPVPHLERLRARYGKGARVLLEILGPKSVILLDEDEHMEQRKLLLPAFHGDATGVLRPRTGMTPGELAETSVRRRVAVADAG